MHALGIDIGSTNVKAVVVDADGATVAATSRPLAWQRAGDVAEQDAVALWQAVLGALEAVAGAVGREVARDVGAVGVCGQYSSIVPTDAIGEPTGAMRLYVDQRGTPHCHAILAEHEEAFATWMERHPIPPVGGGLALGHLLALQHDEPAIHERTAAHLEPVDHVVARLTGVLAATQGSMFASQLIDNRRLGVTTYDAELVAMAGVDATRLPRLVEVGSVIGELLPAVAAAVGFRAGVPVLTGLTDSCAQALATGAARADRLGVAIGTTGVVLGAAAEPGFDLDHEVLTMPGASMERYLVSAENGIAGRAVEHVLDRFVHPSDAMGDHRAPDPFAGFDAALAASSPGAGGVLFLPWLTGSMSPQADASVRGGFVGVSLDTERVDLVRGAAEGVAHNLRWLVPPVEAFTGSSATEVVLTGGAARSPAWSQVLADVLARPVRVLAEPDRSGARAVARWAMGALDAGLPGAVSADGDQPDALGATFEPDPSTAATHDAAHDRFVAAFEALRPLHLGLPLPG